MPPIGRKDPSATATPVHLPSRVSSNPKVLLRKLEESEKQEVAVSPSSEETRSSSASETLNTNAATKNFNLSQIELDAGVCQQEVCMTEEELQEKKEKKSSANQSWKRRTLTSSSNVKGETVSDEEDISTPYLNHLHQGLLASSDLNEKDGASPSYINVQSECEKVQYTKTKSVSVGRTESEAEKGLPVPLPRPYDSTAQVLLRHRLEKEEIKARHALEREVIDAQHAWEFERVQYLEKISLVENRGWQKNSNQLISIQPKAEKDSDLISPLSSNAKSGDASDGKEISIPPLNICHQGSPFLKTKIPEYSLKRRSPLQPLKIYEQSELPPDSCPPSKKCQKTLDQVRKSEQPAAEEDQEAFRPSGEESTLAMNSNLSFQEILSGYVRDCLRCGKETSVEALKMILGPKHPKGKRGNSRLLIGLINERKKQKKESSLLRSTS